MADEMTVRTVRRTDLVLWAAIVVWTGVIYATIPFAGDLRKNLAEQYGPDVFNYIYPVFGAIGIAILALCLRRFRGADLVRSLVSLAVMCFIYSYYLQAIRYPVERVHFLEYGALGALVFAAVQRRAGSGIAAVISINIVYWIGLGDEAVQHLAPDRVGEIRDCITNLISGALGVCCLFLILDKKNDSAAGHANPGPAISAFMISTLFTGIFLFAVHGFGTLYERKEAGEFHSSLSAGQFQAINKVTRDASAYERSVYEDEAARHLFQREFYFVNDYLITGGGFYRKYDHAYYENRILELYYPRFLERHKIESVHFYLVWFDKAFAAKAMDHTVQLPDSTRAWLAAQEPRYNTLFKSRVKSTLITSFALSDLLFYMVILLGLFAYIYVRLPDR